MNFDTFLAQNKNKNLLECFIFYSSSGKLIRKANYKNGLLNGLELRYYETGELRNSINYKNGMFHGEYLYENADVFIKSNYKNSQRFGLSEDFDGKVIYTKFYF